MWNSEPYLRDYPVVHALGANATPVAFNELYSALQQGVVDGQENGYPTFTSNRYYEVQKYIAETYHMWSIKRKRRTER